MSGAVNVTDLRSEYHVNPLGIDARRPRLSWQLRAGARAVVQSAYQIRVESGGRVVWDTGKVPSDRSIHVRYDGPALRSRARYTWQVRVWDGDEQLSEWSEPAWWEMGLLEASDWQARWIEPPWEVDPDVSQPCPYLRTTFQIAGRVRQARVYVTSHGLYELWLNGQRVGDQVFTPGFTSYHDRLQYQVYDVGPLLLLRENALGAILGDGWYRGKVALNSARNVYGTRLGLLLQLHIVYEDGREQWVFSDGDWRAATGPILSSDLKDGEVYDARLEMPGWDEPGFDDGDWQEVSVADHGVDNLIASAGPPVRRNETFAPVAVLHTPDGGTVLDMGQNLAGWVRMRVRGAADTTIVLTHGEALDKAGNFSIAHLQIPAIGAVLRQEVTYTLRGALEEEFEPHFTVHGFRYVKVEGYPGEPQPRDFMAVAIYSDMPPTGTFACSDARVNQLQQNIEWSMKGNFLDIPTDCPTRERAGWTGDAQVFGETGAFLMDTAASTAKWLKDLAVDQDPSGRVPNWVPDTTRANLKGKAIQGSAGWGDAAVILPWTLYRCYGDPAFLEEQYESMVAWVEYEHTNARNIHWRKMLNPVHWFDREWQSRQAYIWDTKYHWGEWLEPGEGQSLRQLFGMLYRLLLSEPRVATAYCAYSTRLLAEAARVLGKEEDAERYGRLAQEIGQAYVDEFIGRDGRIVPDRQASYVRTLALGLAPETLRPALVERLVSLIRKAGNHLDTGFLSTPFLCHVLTEGGYLDVAYDLLTQDTPPSWLYAVTRGATTIWESWEGIKPDGSVFGSLNHYSYGAVGSWLYRVVAGIGIGAPGYKHVLIQPHPGGGLSHARATYRSVYGEIVSGWAIEEGEMRLDVVIPPNTTATVRLPNAVLSQVTEGGRPLADAPGIGRAVQEDKAVAVEIGSGQYTFAYPYGGTAGT